MIDEPSAEVVRRIFAEYLEGSGDRAVAAGLNRDGVPCPSARRPDQNSHRLADGWQGSTIRSILENPRYTGYAFFGRSTKQEMLLDPDDVAAGVNGSRTLSLEIRRDAREGARADPDGTRPYVLRGLMRCGVCLRKTQGATIRNGAYYRCTARTMAPGSAALTDHPKTVNLKETVLLEPLNDWLGEVFGPDNIDQTVAALLASQDRSGVSGRREAAKKRLADAEARLRRHQAALEAGVDPLALVEVINNAQSERAAARAELDHAPDTHAVSDAEIYAMIDSLGDVGATLDSRKPEGLKRIYHDLGLDLRYEPGEQAVYVAASPRVASACVRGASCTLTTRLTMGS